MSISYSPSPTRFNIAPLTTVFTASPGCEICFIETPTTSRRSSTVDTVCGAYFRDCSDQRPSCLPGTLSWTPWRFYSPGLYCPSGWTTATVMSADMIESLDVSDILTFLTEGETAAFCCPTGFTFSHVGVLVPSWATYPPVCATTMVRGDFVYHTSFADGHDEVRAAIVGTTKSTSGTTISAVGRRRDGAAPTTDVLVAQGRTVTVDPLPEAFSGAPVIQLVWRSQDRPRTSDQTTPAGSSTQDSSSVLNTLPTQTSSSDSSSGQESEPPLSTAAVVGISVGTMAIIVILALVTAVWIRRRRKTKRTAATDPGRKTKPSENSTGGSGDGSGFTPGQKPELDATPVFQTSYLLGNSPISVTPSSTLLSWTLARLCRKFLPKQSSVPTTRQAGRHPVSLGPPQTLCRRSMIDICQDNPRGHVVQSCRVPGGNDYLFYAW